MAHLENPAGRHPRALQEERLMDTEEHRFDFWLVTTFVNCALNGSFLAVVWALTR